MLPFVTLLSYRPLRNWAVKQFLLGTIRVMSDTYFLDHHIQTSIVETLHLRGGQSFSSLKPRGIENSLFMYHIRKLITRGIVEKTTTGFVLTANGARWANQTDHRYRHPKAPRLLIQFIVIRDNAILVSERAAHMAEHLNHYMLPGGLHSFGSEGTAAASSIAQNFQLTLTGARLGSAEIILPGSDYHALVDYYPASAPAGPYRYDDGIFSMGFMPLADALQLPHESANFMPDIIALYQQGELHDRHLFIGPHTETTPR